jgi:transcriptional repressor NrdR
MRVGGVRRSVEFVRCPACGNFEDRVIDSRAADDGSSIRRRRQCEGCSTRFTTFERLEESAPAVIKRDGRRVPFDRAKIESGVRAACKGRPIDEAAVKGMALSVEDVLPAHRGEIEAAAIGEVILEGLRRLDPVAAVRFASVYKSFEDPADFGREIALLGGDEPTAQGLPN